MPLAECYQPTRLETLASARASQLAIESCIVIQERFPESQHHVEAKELHEYFLAVRPLLDNVLNQCIVSARAEPLGIRAEVLLDVLVHPAIKTLSYSYKPRLGISWEGISGYRRHSYLDHLDACDARDGMYLRVEPRLWEKYLPQLSNLTDLNLIGTDKRQLNLVLKIVSTSCQMLEIISIRIENTNDVDALLHLVNIRSLRAIKSWESFYKIPFNMCYDLKNRVNGIEYYDTPEAREVLRYLLSNLPLLEYIPIHNMGVILTRMQEVQAEPLVLVECLECHPSQAKLEAIVDMCSNLTGLYLQDDYDDYTDEDTSLDLTPLTGSNLQVSYLVLSKLMIPDGKLEDFIRIKGSFIKHLRLDNVDSKDMEIIPLSVGKHCPMLEILHLRLEDDLNANHPSATSALAQEPMFQNLVELKLQTSTGTKTHWEMFLPCLYPAERLKTLDLHDGFESGALFTQAVLNLLDNNPMSELEELVFEECEIQSVELLTRLTNLPRLRKFALHACTATEQVIAYVNFLRNSVDNLDLLITSTWRKYAFDGEVDLA